MKHEYFFIQMAFALHGRDGSGDINNSDYPPCPDCGAIMKSTLGDLSYGEGHWDCPNCGFSFCEDDLARYLEAAQDYFWDLEQVGEEFDIDAYEDGEYYEEEE